MKFWLDLNNRYLLYFFDRSTGGEMPTWNILCQIDLRKSYSLYDMIMWPKHIKLFFFLNESPLRMCLRWIEWERKLWTNLSTSNCMGIAKIYFTSKTKFPVDSITNSLCHSRCVKRAKGHRPCHENMNDEGESGRPATTDDMITDGLGFR